MPAVADARHANFAAFVARAVRAAKDTHGWTQEEVANRAGFSRSTLQRWLAGEWKEDPKGGEIQAFCDALDIPTQIPLMILWPGKSRRAEVPEPIPLADPDFELVARRLRDPNVSDQEKFHIRETIRSLASRVRRVG